MSPKELLIQFYESDIVNNLDLVEQFYHKDCELHWNSSKDFKILKYKDILDFFKNINNSYVSLRYEVSHLLEEGSYVTSRHTVYARTIENDDEETPLAHYISIWVEQMDASLNITDYYVMVGEAVYQCLKHGGV